MGDLEARESIDISVTKMLHWLVDRGHVKRVDHASALEHLRREGVTEEMKASLGVSGGGIAYRCARELAPPSPTSIFFQRPQVPLRFFSKMPEKNPPGQTSLRQTSPIRGVCPSLLNGTISIRVCTAIVTTLREVLSRRPVLA